MAEVKDPVQEGQEGQDAQTPAAQEAPAQEAPAQEAPAGSEGAAPGEGGAPQKEKRPPMTKKKKRKIIRWSVIGGAALILLIVVAKLTGGKGEKPQVVEDVVGYNAITSKVQGNGITKAKNSENITLTTSGTVQDVLVSEGQKVTAGTPLFTIDSEAARTAVEKARKDVEGFRKTLETKQKDLAGLNLAPIFGGKLLETATLNPGDEVGAGTTVAKVADDSVLRLTQYYSYAYQGDIRVGQSASVSIPALTSTLPGKVSAVHMVERITPEGSKLFQVEFTIKNPGSLTADMIASAVLSAGGESVYPYESGKLEYNRVGDLKTTVGGTVISSGLVDYLSVSAGQVVLQIDGGESESDLFSTEQSLADAEKTLETAQKNLDNCNAVAPIDGTVMGLAIQPGQEIAANTTVISIADTSTIIVDATVDERNIGYVTAGMPVDLDQWGTPFFGTVDSVSLNSKVENGVAAYPMVISVDNADGAVMTGSNVTYNLVASQNDNCLTLPIQSVKNAQFMDGESGYVVFVKADKAPEDAVELAVPVDGVPEGYYPVKVEIGISDDYNVEIKSGVEEGATVFTTVQMDNAYGY